jgi:hypothetical protein
MSLANVGGFAGGAAKGMAQGQNMDFNSQMGPLQLEHLDLQNQGMRQKFGSGQGYTDPNDSIGLAGIDDISKWNRHHNNQGLVPMIGDPLGDGGNQSQGGVPSTGGHPTPAGWVTRNPYQSGMLAPGSVPGMSWAPGGMNTSNYLMGDPYNNAGNYFGIGGGGMF